MCTEVPAAVLAILSLQQAGSHTWPRGPQALPCLETSGRSSLLPQPRGKRQERRAGEELAGRGQEPAVLLHVTLKRLGSQASPPTEME